MAQHNGKIAQVIGPVVDVRFDTEGGTLPEILDALEITNGDQKLILEVQKHIGEDMVRAIAMDSTDGIYRGMEVRPLGSPIKMPTGDQVKGRLFNVVGQTIDGINALDNSNPYMMWRFLVAAAGEPEFKMDKQGPTGQKFVTVAYSDADAEIINATAKTLGVKGTHIGTRSSTEGPGTGITSPVKAFKGYPR